MSQSLRKQSSQADNNQSALGKRSRPRAPPKFSEDSTLLTKSATQQDTQIVQADEEIEYLPNGLPKNYNTMVRPGVPDGNDPNNPVIVYADGVFDMYHVGHAKVLEQAKKLFKHTYLIVGVSGDEETIAKKGKIVMNEIERCEILEHCKWVDEVLCPCPWVVDVEFLREKGIHYVAHDDLPYGSVGQQDIYYKVKSLGMFRATQRTEGISTSDVILRIIKDYDMYVERSFQRGYKRQDLGISATKAFRVKLKEKLRNYKDQFIFQQLKNESKGGSKKGSKSTMQALIDMFQNLEYQTEKLWYDYIAGYQTDKPIKYQINHSTSEENDEDEMGGVKRIPSAVFNIKGKNPAKKLKKKEASKSLCQRVCQFIVEQLDLDLHGAQEEPISDDFINIEDDDDEAPEKSRGGQAQSTPMLQKLYVNKRTTKAQSKGI